MFLIILLWASVAYVPPGKMGVLVYFGRVTGETLPAGTHFVSPFKINHVFSVRTQAQEEHTSTPSMEGLNLEIDTSLIYHLDQSHAADVYSKLGRIMRTPSSILTCVPLFATPPPDIPPTRCIQVPAKKWKTRSNQD